MGGAVPPFPLPASLPPHLLTSLVLGGSGERSAIFSPPPPNSTEPVFGLNFGLKMLQDEILPKVQGSQVTSESAVAKLKAWLWKGEPTGVSEGILSDPPPVPKMRNIKGQGTGFVFNSELAYSYHAEFWGDGVGGLACETNDGALCDRRLVSSPCVVRKTRGSPTQTPRKRDQGRPSTPQPSFVYGTGQRKPNTPHPNPHR